MRELMAKVRKAKKAIMIDALAFSVNSSFPQFSSQSTTLVEADEDADIRRYAIICTFSISNPPPKGEKRK